MPSPFQHELSDSSRDSLHSNEPRVHSILHLEDNPNDRELSKRALRSGGFPCSVTYAVGREDFEQYVENQQFDLILSDYTIPAYSGGEALKFAHRVVPDCPFVFLSGTIGEERAVESLRMGAADFVLKDRMNRLVPTLQRVIEDAGHRTHRAEAERKLRASEERFRTMAETIPDVFWIADPQFMSFEYVSPAFETVFGMPMGALEADPAAWMNSILPEDRGRVTDPWKPIPTGVERTQSFRIRRPDGEIRWLEERRFASPEMETGGDRIIGITSDITGRKQLEADLNQAQKLEAIGQMAGKTAHDFNNFIVVISGHAQLLLRRKDLPSGVKSSVKEIQAAGERSAKLARQLLLFGRKQRAQLTVCDLNELVGGMMQLLRDLVGASYEVRLESNCAHPTLFADRTMLEQVLMNLVVNGRDAMPQGGRIVISTDLVQVLDNHEGCPPGKYVRLGVRDSGTGIPPEILPHIFEPFYTTIDSNKGTGLGLATVFGIVKQHQGRIEVQSDAANGTLFTIYLPADRNAE